MIDSSAIDKLVAGYTPPRVVEVTGFSQVSEAWRCPVLVPNTDGPGEEYFHAGTVLRLHGAEHLARRRAMSMLLSRRGHQYFREQWLLPTAESALANVLSKRDDQGIARADLADWGKRVNQRLGAALVGLDDATTEAGADELLALTAEVSKIRPHSVEVVLYGFSADGDDVKEGLAARQKIIDRFFTPALDRREALVAEVNAGRLAKDELPQDLLTLMALGLDPAWEDRALAAREAFLLLGAASHTTSTVMQWTLKELFAWFGEHPEDLPLRTDRDFLLRASQEAMRLHPVVPGFTRGAMSDVTLSDGTEIPQGDVALIRSGPPSLDEQAYGEDADRFNPHREVASDVYPFGFAFGTGPHMCYGVPIVMGAKGLDGSLVHLIDILLSAGIEPDPDAPPPVLEGTRGQYVEQRQGYSFPVIFRGLS